MKNSFWGLNEMNDIKVLHRVIGSAHPSFIIAELSANHNNDMNRARQIIKMAAEAGADAVKFQTYTADTLTFNSESEEFQVSGTIWEGKNLYQLYQEAHLPWEWHDELFKYTKKLGLVPFSTPFDFTAVDFLEELRVPLYKIASSELVDIPLLRKVASTGKPVILSTGMGTLEEIKEAVQTLRKGGCKDLVLLKCTAAYPAPIEEANLLTIPHMSTLFGTIIGLSDHTSGSTAPITATVLGAKVIEKHLTLRRSDGGPDSEFSMEPEEFTAMIDAVRAAEKALGRVQYAPTEKEKRSRDFRRSLYVVVDIKKGEAFTCKNVRSIRPANGMHTRRYDEVLGEKAKFDIPAGTPLREAHFK